MLDGKNFVIVNDGTSKFFKCLKCPYRSEKSPQFLEHVVRCKGLAKNAVFTKSIELPDSPPHETNKIRKMEFDCVLCPKKFTIKEQLEDHVKSHWPYKCRVCDGKFKTQLAQRSHEFRFHDPEYDPHSTACKNCPHKFQRPWDLSVHLVNVHFKNGMIQCDNCPKLFETEKILEDHCRDCHSGNTAVITNNGIMENSSSIVEIIKHCDEANMKSQKVDQKTKESNAKNGPAITSNEPVRRTSNCLNLYSESEDTYNVESLLVPIATDAGKFYYCRDCPVVFDKRKEYKAHIRAHRPYKCKICRKTFKTEHFLHAHGFSEHHSDYDRNSTQCKSCSEKFEDSSQLFFHLVRDHDMVKLTHACHLCKKSFEFEKNYEFHMTRAHKHSLSKDRKCYSNTSK